MMHSTFPLALVATETLQSIDDTIIQTTEQAGTYPVTATYVDEQGNVTTKTFYVTIQYPRTVVVEAYSEGIDAMDFLIEKGNFSTLDMPALISLAKAHAWNTRTGNKVEVISATTETLDHTLGIHKVTFATANGTATTVNVQEVEHILMESTEYYVDYNFELNLWFLSVMTAIIVFGVLSLYLLNYWRMQKTLEKAERVLYNDDNSRNVK